MASSNFFSFTNDGDRHQRSHFAKSFELERRKKEKKAEVQD
jgi:hypothetical protein